MLFTDMLKKMGILCAKTNQTIENNLEILAELNYSSIKTVQISPEETQNTVLLILPLTSINNIIRLFDFNIKNNPYYSKDIKDKLLFLRHGETFFNLDPDKDGRKTN